MDYSTLLNETQLAAVTTDSQYVRIIAGAGSGKTRVLTYRICYLIGERNVDPRSILAIAFTNKVATEMKDRANALLEDESPYLHILTFHSFCARFLREEAAAIGYKPSFTIYDEDDQASLVKDICLQMGYKKGDDIIKESLRYIRNKKGAGYYPDDITPNPKNKEEESRWITIFRNYEDRKAEMFALDFDDLLLKAILILGENEEIRLKWRRRFTHILVDEFQDTNDVQYKLLRYLLRPETSVYVVGDPDQTIYTWRGANQKIILDFEKDFPGTETIILNRNYRSTNVILEAANKLIKNNKKRVPKDLFTTETDGEKIETYKGYSAEAEAEWVSNKIRSIARRQSGSYSNIAVLYRSSYATRPFESRFAQDGVPYRIFGGLRFYQRMEVKDVLAYFRLLTNELDDVAFDRIVNVPRRGIGDTSLEIIKSEAAAAGQSEYQYIREIDGGKSKLQSRVINALLAMSAKIEATKAKLNENIEAYSATLKSFVSEIGYLSYIADEESPNEDRLSNVNALFDDINSFITRNPESSFEQYLQNVSLLTSQDDMNGGNYVSLMTIHVAKGLEFDNVFVIGMNQGSFPSDRALNETGRDGEEEERRLAYVAMTRARKKLYMSCNSSYSYVTDGKAMPSQFFEEADLAFPPSQDYSGWDDRPYYGGSRGKNNGWSKVYKAPASYFSDGDAISPFEEKKKKEPEPTKPLTNGISDWKVGDVAYHEKFGEGEVCAIITDTIIQINFKSEGKKTLIANHPLLSRKSSKGGTA